MLISVLRLGLALQCLGNTRLKQGLIDDSYNAYQGAFSNFRAILGPDSFRVGQVCLKMGEILGKQGGRAHLAK
jgi:hypothetical protein